MKRIKDKVVFRRKRQGRTDYKRRLGLLMSGKPRLVVRKSLSSTLVQLIAYEAKGDRILLTASASDIKKLGWSHSTGSIPAAYLIGYAAGKKMLAKGVTEAILDIGLQTKGQRIFAAMKGAIDAGVAIPHEDKVVPSEDRIKGEHLSKDVPQTFKTVKEKLK